MVALEVIVMGIVILRTENVNFMDQGVFVLFFLWFLFYLFYVFWGNSSSLTKVTEKGYSHESNACSHLFIASVFIYHATFIPRGMSITASGGNRSSNSSILKKRRIQANCGAEKMKRKKNMEKIMLINCHPTAKF